MKDTSTRTMIKKSALAIAVSLLSAPAFARQPVSEVFWMILPDMLVVIGLIAAFGMFSLGVRTSGSKLSEVFNLFGLGILSFVIALLSVTWMEGAVEPYSRFVHDGFFALGFVIMFWGSRKVARMLL